MEQFLEFLELCALDREPGVTGRAPGHLGQSAVVKGGSFGHGAPPTPPAPHNSDAQTIFREETDRGNGIATSKTASSPIFVKIARTDREHQRGPLRPHRAPTRTIAAGLENGCVSVVVRAHTRGVRSTVPPAPR